MPARKKRKPKAGGGFTSFHYGDVHFPFQDDAALAVVYSLIEASQPDLIVCHGDLVDAYPISRFEKDPRHRVSLQQEIEMAAVHLGIITDLCPDARKVVIEGNHEDRLRRQIWNMAKDIPAREILALVHETLSWPRLLGLDELGWEWAESKFMLFDRLVLKHGNTVRKWAAYSARSEWERYGKGGISGHTHRMGAFFHRDLNGADGWWELGCLCDLNPTYVEAPDWQQGALLVHWSEDRKIYHAEQIHIHAGKAMFRGELHAA